jgi:hypothetical protein
MREKRILLDEKDFKTLVAGGIIEKDNVKIALQDIGYLLMLSIIEHKYDELCKNR